mgnify:FL=1
MKPKKYTVDQLRDAVKTSFSYSQALIKLSIIPAGSNYATIKKAVGYFGIDISHFRGQGWNKNMKFGPKRPLQVYLNNEYPIRSWRLKNRLLKEGLIESICHKCGLDEWLDSPIPLELHHEDGDHLNNSYDNLTLLCPNCHALTDTYRGKNMFKDKHYKELHDF